MDASKLSKKTLSHPKKVTVRASSDIALVKYWGKKDEALRIPENSSISMILDGLDTVTTVEFSQDYLSDQLIINDKKIEVNSREFKRVASHLNRIRALAKKQNLPNTEQFAKVVSKNLFPRSTGLSSSGSGMAALTYAAIQAIGLYLSEKEISILARLASGTACRCAVGGFVEWIAGDSNETSFSKTIFDKDHWDIRDVIAVVSSNKKKISSTDGHTTARSSIFYNTRQENIDQKIKDVKKAILQRDFSTLGALVESECLEFHSILLTAKPPLVLWYPGTLQVINEVQAMREDGIECYFTINTGFNVHVLTLPKFETQVRDRLDKLNLVEKTMLARVGDKPKYMRKHLF